jgi:hypothetical protein
MSADGETLCWVVEEIGCIVFAEGLRSTLALIT